MVSAPWLPSGVRRLIPADWIGWRLLPANTGFGELHIRTLELSRAIFSGRALGGLLGLTLMGAPFLWGAEDPLQRCTVSKIPLVGSQFECRATTEAELESLTRYWAYEDDAELCHYFYFPLSDPTASKQLLLDNYLIMQSEILERGVQCKRDHRNVFWYRGEGTQSMLQKLIDRYSLDPALDREVQ